MSQKNIEDRESLSARLVECLQAARRVTVLTGAGISAESGIPTFREAQTGLWAQYDPMLLASPQGFERTSIGAIADWHLAGPGGQWLPRIAEHL